MAAKIDAHLLSSASDLSYLLKSRAADHHKDLTLSAPKNLSLTDEQINAVLEFYEKVLEVGNENIDVKVVSGKKFIKIVMKTKGKEILKNKNAVYRKDQEFDVYTMILRRNL